MRIVYFIILFKFVCNYAKNQGLSNSLANISHENLLDNPWFTVNQRGQSSYTTSIGTHIYTVDRWKTYSLSVDVIDNGVTLTNVENNYVNFYSQQENYVLNKLLRKTLTLSVMLSDGTIYSGNITINNRTTESIFTDYRAYTSDTFAIGILEDKDSWQIYVAVSPNKSVSIRAVKLEIGSISTLSMDSTPNYAEELLKCQRHFVRFNPTDSYTAFGAGIYSSNHVFAEATLPTVLRAKPSVSFSSVRAHSYGRNDVSVSSITVNNYINNIVSLKCAPESGANFVNGDYCEIQLDVNNYLELSADL